MVTDGVTAELERTMRTAKEVLADWASKHDTPYFDADMPKCADSIIAALSDAGYVIVPGGDGEHFVPVQIVMTRQSTDGG
jgi:hypothetical protein